MSYQVLARKWRPKIFREMVGQEHVLKALINALDHNRLHHAYLFTGTRGVGKTTIARILAKCLNCEVGVSSEPCGQCSACTSIGEGRFVDLIEVDAASRTKVEDTRELLDNVQYAPTMGRYKVYLIDEVHMLSTHSFNALLKTLEEPPPHVKFLLATTDPQKLPATILSRCLQFNLKNMSPERIVGHLQNVLEKEMISFEEPALWLLGRAADGSMRDALSLTDQAIAFGSGKLEEVDVRTMLGTIDQTVVYDIISSLIASDAAQMLNAVQRMSEHAPDFSSALEELLTMFHKIAIAQALPGAGDNNYGDIERISDFASKLAAEDVQLFYQIGLNGRRDLPLAPDPKSGFEMVLLRMLAFKPAGIPQLPQSAINNSGVVDAGGSLSAKKPEAVQGASAPQQPRTTDVSEISPVSDSSTVNISSSVASTASDLNTTIAQAASDVVEAPLFEVENTASDQIPWASESNDPTNVSDVGESSSQREKIETAETENQNTAQLKPEIVSYDNTAAWKKPLATAQETVSENHDNPVQGTAVSISTAKIEQQEEVIRRSAIAENQHIATADATPVDIVPSLNDDQGEKGNPISLAQIQPSSWSRLFSHLEFGGVVGNIASHCVLDRVEGCDMYFLLDEKNATLFNDSYTSRIEEHLTVTLNSLVKIHIKVCSVSAETPSARKERITKERKQLALDTIQSDPNVQTLINDFDAVLDQSSVEPI